MFRHIAVSMLVPYCIFLFIYARSGFHVESRKLARLPFILLCCAIWGLMPSILGKLHLWPLDKIANNFLISNIFFFYGILRKTPHTGSILGLGVIFFIFFSLMFIFKRHLRAQEREIRLLGREG